jgi:glycosyltransferase involved in cell wall biosynthesis
MRVLQVIRSRGFGGAENHVLSLSLGLREMGHEVLLVCPAESWIGERCSRHGLPLCHVGMRGMYDLLSYWKLHRIIKRWRADIVHAHQVRPAQYAGISALGTEAIPLCTAHSAAASKHMRRCRHIIAVSNAVMENLLRHTYPRHAITCVHNGVPDVPRGERAALRRELGIPDGQFAVVCAARFNPQKGQDLLVSAVDFLAENIHVYFLGDTNNNFGRNVLSAAVGRPHIHFLGYREDAPRLLRAFDAVAAPSRQEAFSLSLAEAAAAGVPVVATRVGGIPEVMVDGETGLLVRQGDMRALAEAIMKLSADTAFSALLSRGARARYERYFTLRGMLEKTEAVYRKLLGVRQAKRV